jgi:hypothetical protein
MKNEKLNPQVHSVISTWTRHFNVIRLLYGRDVGDHVIIDVLHLGCKPIIFINIDKLLC